MNSGSYEIGMIGLGVMGRNFALNIAEKGFPVAGYDADQKQVEALMAEAEARPVAGVGTMDELVRLLRPPRAVIMLVPAGPLSMRSLRALSPCSSPVISSSMEGILTSGRPMVASMASKSDTSSIWEWAFPAARPARASGRASCRADRLAHTPGCGRSSRRRPRRWTGSRASPTSVPDLRGTT